MKTFLKTILAIIPGFIFTISLIAQSQTPGDFIPKQSNNQKTISDQQLQGLLDETGKPLFDKKSINGDTLETDVLNERFLNGYAAGDWFGNSVSNAGDVNQDGFDDIIIGAHYNDAGGTNAGRAYIYYGGTIFNSVPDVTLTGESASSGFGFSVASAGDVNGDSYSDVIVGAFSYSSYTGRSYIFYGGSTMNNIADVTLQGEAANNLFGHSVSSAGDVNGDGYSDVVIGAYGYSSYTGRSYIYYGSSIMNSVADLILTGQSTSNYFGHSVSEAGDVNGDGFSDVIIGAKGFTSNTGRAYIYFGSATMNNIADVTMTGEGTSDSYGVSVSSAGDVNGDGYMDVIVGANGYRNTSYTGRAYIYYGGVAMDNFTDVKMTGETTGNYFGNSVSSAGDINGDGFSDLIVGAFGFSGNTGRAYIYKGGPAMDTVCDKILNGEAGGDYFGYSVSSAGDVNGDGISDVLIGAPFNDLNGSNAGRAYLYMVSMTGNDVADIEFTSDVNNSIESTVSDAGDVNGDGFADIMVHSRYNPNTGE